MLRCAAEMGYTPSMQALRELYMDAHRGARRPSHSRGLLNVFASESVLWTMTRTILFLLVAPRRNAELATTTEPTAASATEAVTTRTRIPLQRLSRQLIDIRVVLHVDDQVAYFVRLHTVGFV